ncbi:hypothetical protein [Paraherbaspirillum soli]|uniref:Uncharacterized protein n=1 Tax=Paraherbaspirillum soli TaxID=631222 RepID=A0ABW0MFT0_9BURK
MKTAFAIFTFVTLLAGCASPNSYRCDDPAARPIWCNSRPISEEKPPAK